MHDQEEADALDFRGRDELIAILLRWEDIASRVSFHQEYPYTTIAERDRLVEFVDCCNHNVVIRDELVIDYGWLVCDWGERLLEESPSRVWWDDEWEAWHEDDQIDMGVAEIVRKLDDRFPHVDTTAFCEFLVAAESQLHDELSSKSFEHRVPDKRPLLVAYERAKAVSMRIQILTVGEHGKRYRSARPTRVSVDLSTYVVTIEDNPMHRVGPLAPHEAQYINAMVEAKRNGTPLVTETVLKELPGCKSRNVTRDFNGTEGAKPVRGIKQKYPKLWRIIGSVQGKGRYLKV